MLSHRESRQKMHEQISPASLGLPSGASLGGIIVCQQAFFIFFSLLMAVCAFGVQRQITRRSNKRSTSGVSVRKERKNTPTQRQAGGRDGASSPAHDV